MSTLSSSLNSSANAVVATSTARCARTAAERHYLRVSRLMTLVLGRGADGRGAGGATWLGSERSVVDQVLGVAGFTTGHDPGPVPARQPARGRSRLGGGAGGPGRRASLAVLAVWLPCAWGTPVLAWPWYAPVGDADVTVRRRRWSWLNCSAAVDGPRMDHLQTEARNPASTNLDELTPLRARPADERRGRAGRPPPWRRRRKPSPGPSTSSPTGCARAAGWSTPAPARRAGSACSTRPNARRRSTRRPGRWSASSPAATRR